MVTLSFAGADQAGLNGYGGPIYFTWIRNIMISYDTSYLTHQRLIERLYLKFGLMEQKDTVTQQKRQTRIKTLDLIEENHIY